MTTTLQKPTFTTTTDAKKFFYDAPTDDGGTERRMMRFIRNVVVITTAFGETVAFMKTNRGSQYRDSRGQKVKAKRSEFSAGDEYVIRPLMISEAQVQSELRRLLDDETEADRAFYALKG